MTCNPFYQATRRETENARKGIQASDWLLLASTSPVSDVERGLILLRSTGAWMERLRQLIHEIHRRSLWQVLGIYVVASVVCSEELAHFPRRGLMHH